MSEKDKPPADGQDPALEWAKLWQTMAESSNRMVEAWSGSMAPFMLARLSEKPAGFGDGNELSATIERMVQGPRLADVWDIDRKIALAFSAWIEMHQRLASYNAVASAPWAEASKRFLETMSAAGTSETSTPDWREAFAKWSEISNEELIRNQRTDGFLQAQKELLQAGLQLRCRQSRSRSRARCAGRWRGTETRRRFRTSSSRRRSGAARPAEAVAGSGCGSSPA